MKKLILALALVLPQSASVFAATPKTIQTHPQVTVQVVFSRYVITPGHAANYQQLEAVIEGQKVELYSDEATGVLAPGDYKAQPISTWNGAKDTHSYIPKDPNGYDLFVIYRFILPDGTTRDFFLVGLGAKMPDSTAPAPANP